MLRLFLCITACSVTYSVQAMTRTKPLKPRFCCSRDIPKSFYEVVHVVTENLKNENEQSKVVMRSRLEKFPKDVVDKEYQRIQTTTHFGFITCSLCNKQNLERGPLLKHVLFHHHQENRPLKCPMCCMGFVRQYELTKHMKKYHLHETNTAEQKN